MAFVFERAGSRGIFPHNAVHKDTVEEAAHSWIQFQANGGKKKKNSSRIISENHLLNILVKPFLPSLCLAVWILQSRFDWRLKTYCIKSRRMGSAFGLSCILTATK